VRLEASLLLPRDSHRDLNHAPIVKIAVEVGGRGRVDQKAIRLKGEWHKHIMITPGGVVVGFVVWIDIWVWENSMVGKGCVCNYVACSTYSRGA
jgi:hypothetical protein